MRTWLTVILLCAAATIIPTPAEGSVAKAAACTVISNVLGCVVANASAGHSCTPSGTCWYSLKGGASACALLGGTVSMLSAQLGYKDAQVPANGCEGVSNSRTDTIQCVEVQGAFHGVGGADYDYAADCATPLDGKVGELIEIDP